MVIARKISNHHTTKIINKLKITTQKQNIILQRFYCHGEVLLC